MAGSRRRAEQRFGSSYDPNVAEVIQRDIDLSLSRAEQEFIERRLREIDEDTHVMSLPRRAGKSVLAQTAHDTKLGMQEAERRRQREVAREQARLEEMRRSGYGDW